jgi:hypothetical protein
VNSVSSLDRVGEEVSKAITFLASDGAGWTMAKILTSGELLFHDQFDKRQYTLNSEVNVPQIAKLSENSYQVASSLMGFLAREDEVS